MTLPLPWDFRSEKPDGDKIQDTFEQVATAVSEVKQFLFFGNGVPTFTPTGRALYIRTNGGTGTTLYVYEGSGWVAK